MDIVIHSAFVTVSFLGVVSEDLIPMPSRMTSQHAYEVRPRKDQRDVDLTSDTLPFGRLWYAEPNAISNAIDYASFSAAHMML